MRAIHWLIFFVMGIAYAQADAQAQRARDPETRAYLIGIARAWRRLTEQIGVLTE